jgi:hypothetical protein
MALTIFEQPYPFTPRGQKLLFTAGSTNNAQTGFKFGVSVLEVGTSRLYEFFLTPNPGDQSLYFDMAQLVVLRNFENEYNFHSMTVTGVYSENDGDGWKSYEVTISEWWEIGGVLTHNVSADETVNQSVFNASYQVSNGYRPNVLSVDTRVGFAINDSSSIAMSNRFPETHVWEYATTFGYNGKYTFIPVFETDYGMLFVPGGTFISTNDINQYRITLKDSTGALHTGSVTIPASEICGVPAYPANLNVSTESIPKPEDYPNWIAYVIDFRESGAVRSIGYCFYNAALYGQSDCKHDYVRLGWVNSRGGWDYFNFIKKNENSFTIERKQYRKVLANFFEKADRQLYDRDNIVNQVLTVTSDWIQEQEFVFLRQLLISSQVHLLNLDGSYTPVSLQENSYTEKRERNGKLYNLTLKVIYSQDYWV